LFSFAGCKTYIVDEISIKSDSTKSLMGQPGRTFSVEIGNKFLVVTQMYQGKIPYGAPTSDYVKTYKYKAAIERAIIKKMSAGGFTHSVDFPEIQIIYVLDFSGKYMGGYSKNWTISIGGFDRRNQRVLFEVSGKFRSIPEMNEELASELIEELMNSLSMTGHWIESG